MVSIEINGRNSGVIVDRIGVESRDTQLRPCICQIIHGKVIQVIRADSIEPDAKVIDQIGRDDVSVANRRVSRIRWAVRCVGWKGVATLNTQVLPMVADEKTYVRA